MKGIEYYDKLINKLISKGIEPLVTIYHWGNKMKFSQNYFACKIFLNLNFTDLPQYIQDLGGWTNPMVVDYFKEYADVLFEHYGSRVKRWITGNNSRFVVQPSRFLDEIYNS